MNSALRPAIIITSFAVVLWFCADQLGRYKSGTRPTQTFAEVAGTEDGQAEEYEDPGGAVDRSDADPLSAARRELLEETGYASKRIEKLCTLVPNSAVHNNLIHAFIAYDIEKVAEPNLGGGEEIEFRFLTVDQLLAQIEAGKFRQAFYLASTLYALKKMGRLR